MHFHSFVTVWLSLDLLPELFEDFSSVVSDAMVGEVFSSASVFVFSSLASSGMFVAPVVFVPIYGVKRFSLAINGLWQSWQRDFNFQWCSCTCTLLHEKGI
jgi:hypothetical protein